MEYINSNSSGLEYPMIDWRRCNEDRADPAQIVRDVQAMATQEGEALAGAHGSQPGAATAIEARIGKDAHGGAARLAELSRQSADQDIADFQAFKAAAH